MFGSIRLLQMALPRGVRSVTPGGGQALSCSGQEEQPQLLYPDLCHFTSFCLVDVPQRFTAYYCLMFGDALWAEAKTAISVRFVMWGLGRWCHLLLGPHRSRSGVPQRLTDDKAISHSRAGGTGQEKNICTERPPSTKNLLPQEKINEGKRNKAFRACYQFKHLC